VFSLSVSSVGDGQSDSTAIGIFQRFGAKLDFRLALALRRQKM
jgi:hypothetical protein